MPGDMNQLRERVRAAIPRLQDICDVPTDAEVDRLIETIRVGYLNERATALNLLAQIKARLHADGSSSSNVEAEATYEEWHTDKLRETVRELEVKLSEAIDGGSAMRAAAVAASATAERALERLVLYQGVVDAAKALHKAFKKADGVFDEVQDEVEAVDEAYAMLARALRARPSA